MPKQFGENVADSLPRRHPRKGPAVWRFFNLFQWFDKGLRRLCGRAGAAGLDPGRRGASIGARTARPHGARFLQNGAREVAGERHRPRKSVGFGVRRALRDASARRPGPSVTARGRVEKRPSCAGQWRDGANRPPASAPLPRRVPSWTICRPACAAVRGVSPAPKSSHACPACPSGTPSSPPGSSPRRPASA